MHIADVTRRRSRKGKGAWRQESTPFALSKFRRSSNTVRRDAGVRMYVYVYACIGLGVLLTCEIGFFPYVIYNPNGVYLVTLFDVG